MTDPKPFFIIARRMENLLQQMVAPYISLESGLSDRLAGDTWGAAMAVRREFYEMKLDEVESALRL